MTTLNNNFHECLRCQMFHRPLWAPKRRGPRVLPSTHIHHQSGPGFDNESYEGRVVPKGRMLTLSVSY